MATHDSSSSIDFPFICAETCKQHIRAKKIEEFDLQQVEKVFLPRSNEKSNKEKKNQEEQILSYNFTGIEMVFMIFFFGKIFMSLRYCGSITYKIVVY